MAFPPELQGWIKVYFLLNTDPPFYRYSLDDVISEYISVDRYQSSDIFFIQLIAKNLRSHPIALYQMLQEINEFEDRQNKSKKKKEPTFVIENI